MHYAAAGYNTSKYYISVGEKNKGEALFILGIAFIGVIFDTQDTNTASEPCGEGSDREDAFWVGACAQLLSSLSALAITSVEHLDGGPLVCFHQLSLIA